jgi:hypothetical protein
VSPIVTVDDALGANVVFAKPFSCRGGSSALAGNCRYSWLISLPARVPLFVKTKLTEEALVLRSVYCQDV